MIPSKLCTTIDSSGASSNTETIEIDNGADLKDGTYTLEEKLLKRLPRSLLSMTVADGKISESNYDYLNEAGESKKMMHHTTKTWKQNLVSPEEFIPNFNEAFVSAVNAEDGSVANMDVVSGQPQLHSFVIYAQQLLNAAEKGDQTTIEVDNFVTE